MGNPEFGPEAQKDRGAEALRSLADLTPGPEGRNSPLPEPDLSERILTARKRIAGASDMPEDAIAPADSKLEPSEVAVEVELSQEEREVAVFVRAEVEPRVQSWKRIATLKGIFGEGYEKRRSSRRPEAYLGLLPYVANRMMRKEGQALPILYPDAREIKQALGLPKIVSAMIPSFD